MAYEQRDMSGSLFKNKDKKSEKHPDLTGSIMIGGVEYRLSAWTKEGKSGKWLSLAASDKEGQKSTKPSRSNDDDDSIPF